MQKLNINSLKQLSLTATMKINTNTNTLPRNQNDAIFNKTFSNNEEDDGFTKVERKSKINNNVINNNSTYDNKKNFKKY